jgi:hypothetical protein
MQHMIITIKEALEYLSISTLSVYLKKMWKIKYNPDKIITPAKADDMPYIWFLFCLKISPLIYRVN